MQVIVHLTSSNYEPCLALRLVVCPQARFLIFGMPELQNLQLWHEGCNPRRIREQLPRMMLVLYTEVWARCVWHQMMCSETKIFQLWPDSCLVNRVRKVGEEIARIDDRTCRKALELWELGDTPQFFADAKVNRWRV